MQLVDWCADIVELGPLRRHADDAGAVDDRDAGEPEPVRVAHALKAFDASGALENIHGCTVFAVLPR
jgi:hypothetical protein